MREETGREKNYASVSDIISQGFEVTTVPVFVLSRFQYARN
jgi:hypothetical protein